MYLHQFVLHAALDAVNEQLWATTSMHLGNVDKFNNLMVAAYVTAAHVKFLLLHDGKNDEAIRLFFKDVYDIYVRVSNKRWFGYDTQSQTSYVGKAITCNTLQVCMNPFFTTVGRISSPGFGQKVRILARTHFRT